MDTNHNELKSLASRIELKSLANDIAYAHRRVAFHEGKLANCRGDLSALKSEFANQVLRQMFGMSIHSVITGMFFYAGKDRANIATFELAHLAEVDITTTKTYFTGTGHMINELGYRADFPIPIKWSFDTPEGFE